MVDKVEVLDSIMGSGKTQNIIRWMESNPEEKYVYVSPLLSEVEEGGRLSRNLKNLSFEYPQNDLYSKGEDMLAKLKAGYNIACTHSLYLSLTEEHLNQIKEHGYTVIIDEEVNLISAVTEYTRGDYRWLFEHNHIETDNVTGQVSWIGDETLPKDNKYFKFKTYCDNNSMYVTKRDNYMMVSQLPISLISCAKRVIILTYMFDGNILDCFLKIKGIEVIKFDEFTMEDSHKSNISNMVELIKPPKTLFDMNMTKSWYDNKITTDDISHIEKFITNTALRNGATLEDVLYTHPKDRFESDSKRKLLIKPKGYYKKRDGKGGFNKCWLASSTKATNLYADKWCLIHCYNRYPQTPVEAYINDYGSDVGVRLNAEVFALSEMLQWVWRSRIRKGEPIVLAIGSARMCRIFSRWIESL